MNVDPTDFEAFEINHSLFELQIEGVPIWERMRFQVFRDINRQNGGGRAHTDIGNTWRDYVQGAHLFIKNFVIKNPFFSDESDMLFVGHHRRKRLDDTWWDIYCDPLHEAGDYDYTHFEKDYMLTHFTPARTKNLRYLDIIEQSSNIQRALNLNSPTIPPESLDKLQYLEERIQSQFGADIDLVTLVEKILHERRAKLPLYNRLLQRVDPELVVVVVSYGRETFIEACKSQGVPVAELQHGVVYDYHFGYSFSGQRTKTTFPDYFLAFGEFWKESIDYPIPDSQVIPVGYPFLEQSIREYSESDSNNKLIFISQGTIGEKLSKFALELDRYPGFDCKIVYKLHPGEYDRWRTEYPWLENADFEIIENQKRLYRLFSESTAQIGVGSTAIYEGLAFNLKTFIYECSGAEALQPLIDDGVAKLISSPEDLRTNFDDTKPDFDRRYYFADNPVERIFEAFKTIRE
jgi:hypothetical protein